MILLAKAIVRMMQYPAESRIVSLTASSAPLNFIRFIVLFFIVVVYETCPDRGGTAYVGQLAACRCASHQAMVAAVVTIDTVFEMIFPASLCPTILEDSQKQLQ